MATTVGVVSPPGIFQTEIIRSDFETVGRVPNCSEFGRLLIHDYVSSEVNVLFGPGGQREQFNGYVAFGNNSAKRSLEETKRMAELVEPTMREVDKHFRRRTQEVGRTVVRAQVIAYKVEEDDSIISRPHRDGTEYLVTVLGLSTKFWRGRFEINPDHEVSDEEIYDLERQVQTRQIAYEQPPEGVIVAKDRDTVHSAPDADPTLVGTRRIRLILSADPASEMAHVFQLD